MKEAIEDLVELYIKRTNDLTDMLKEPDEDVIRKTRLTTKRSIYYQVLGDLQQLLKDEQDET